MKQTVPYRRRDTLGEYGVSWTQKALMMPADQTPVSNATIEPCLCDLIQDDIMKSIMVRDRVAHSSLHLLIDETRARLGL